MTKINSSNNVVLPLIFSEQKNNISLVNNNPSMKDETISSIDLFGMRISGIDLNDIEEAQLVVNIPLIAKDSCIDNDGKKARVHVGKNTTAHVALTIAKNAQNKVVVKSVVIDLSRSVTIKNPSAAFEEKSGNRSVMTMIKDGLADVCLKKISLQEDGQIAVEGKIEALKIFHKRLIKNVGSVSLPTLDNHFLEQLGILAQSSNDAQKNSEQFNIKKILMTLGDLTGKATFSFALKTAPSRISAEKDGSKLVSLRKPVHVGCNGTVDLDAAGDIHVVVKKEPQQIQSGIGNFSLGGALDVSYTQNKFSVGVRGEFEGDTQAVLVHSATKDLSRALPSRNSSPSDVKTFNFRLQAEEVKLNGRVDIQASIDKQNKNITGNVGVILKAKNPFIMSAHRGARFSGETSVGLVVDRLSLHASNAAPTESILAGTKGRVSARVKADETVLNVFPELRPLSMKYGFKVDEQGKIAVTPPKHGVLRFVRPVTNLEGHYERVNIKSSQQQIFPIASEDYFKHIEKITGSPLRDASEVKLLIDGVNSMPERMHLIHNAKEYICFQALEFKNDRSGWQFAKALVEAHKRGVKVYGIIDSVGNIDSLNELDERNEIYHYLLENGIDLKIYNDSFEQGLRSIFAIAHSYPTFKEPSEKSLATISTLIDYIGQITEAIEDPSSGLSKEDRRQLSIAIRRMMGGKEGSSPHLFVSELREILSEPIVETNSWLLALKRLSHVSYRSHEKYLIVDGENAIVGGMNIADEYLRGGSNELIEVDGRMQPAWRDSDVLLNGAIARDAYRCFRRNWLQIAHARLPFKTAKNQQSGPIKASIIQHRPFEDGDDNIANFFLYNLRALGPGEKAWFETAYFLPRGSLKTLQEELVRAAQRGVDVRILTNSKHTSDMGVLVDAARFDYRELLEAGARIFHRVHGRTVHAKVSVFGDNLTCVGSYNLDNRSSSHDSEVVCALYDKATNQQMVTQLTTDMFDQSEELSLEALKSSNFADEIKAAGTLLLGDLI